MAEQGFMAANHAGYVIGQDANVQAKRILEKRIDDGRKSAVKLFEYLAENQPKDQIARGKALAFDVVQPKPKQEPKPIGEALTAIDAVLDATAEAQAKTGLVLRVGDKGDTLGIHKHALQQMATKGEIPGRYLAQLREEGAQPGQGWKLELAAEILKRTFGTGEGASRFLVRAVRGDVFGFLSSKYRRLDSFPIVESFLKTCNEVGAVPVNGTWSDTRYTLKAVVPIVYFPVPGEALVFGVEWGNSDFGHGMHTARAFLERLWCLNGATMENALAQIHLGRDLGDDINISEETRRLDTETSISALRDVVKGCLSEQKREALCAGIRAANDKGLDWKNVKTGLAKKLLKAEIDEAERLYKGDDVVNLPSGASQWRLSNVLSLMAGKVEDPDRKIDLQRLAGEILGAKADKEDGPEAEAA